MFLMTEYQQTFFGGTYSYLTAGKFYPVVETNLCLDTHTILDDDGKAVTVRIDRPSAHLNDIGVFKLYNTAVVELSDKELINQLLDALETCVNCGSMTGDECVLENAETAISAAKNSLKSA